MNLKLYLVVKCTNEGIDSVQAFTSENIAKDILKDNVESEIFVAKDNKHYSCHSSHKNCVRIYYQEGGWTEFNIIEDEVFVEV